MKIHEYQAKQIMKMYGISVPNGSPAFSPTAALLSVRKKRPASPKILTRRLPSLKRRSTQAAAERRAA